MIMIIPFEPGWALIICLKVRCNGEVWISFLLQNFQDEYIDQILP